ADHLRAVADHEHVFSADFAAEAAVHADAALEEELPLEVRPAAEQRRDLGRPLDGALTGSARFHGAALAQSGFRRSIVRSASFDRRRRQHSNGPRPGAAVQTVTNRGAAGAGGLVFKAIVSDLSRGPDPAWQTRNDSGLGCAFR